ncbi:MAG: helix-turn-helix transcriptional regulator [Treponema sp.]|jgi:transcriptional regulator with XRE-family HTH domain|nr:helix-turn-helix transcriptional regulator [Treponema sp.]
MTDIREVLTANLKENRRKQGLTQEQLAEKADVSAHYIAIIETCKAFPKPEMLERLAKALDIETHQLFALPPGTDEVFERLEKNVVATIERVVAKSIKDAFAEESKAKGKT